MKISIFQIVLFSILCFAFCNTYATPAPTPALAFTNDTVWHVLDVEGNELYTITCDEVCGMADGAIRAKKVIGGKTYWAYYTYSGLKMFECQFDAAFNFSSGLAAVGNFTDEKRSRSKNGFINKKGIFLLPLVFDDACSFSEGLAYVMNEEYRGYINNRGQSIITLNNVVGYDFHEGICAVSTRGDHKVGYMDSTGRLIVPMIYDELSYFSEGKAVAHKGRLRGYIDRNNRFVIAPQFDYARPFSQGRAFVGFQSLYRTNRWAIIDSNGTTIKDRKFHEVNEFSDSVALVRENNKWYYVDYFGNKTIEEDFDNAMSFKDGFAFAGNSVSEYGIINKKGEFIFKIGTPWKVFDLRNNKGAILVRNKN